MLIIGPLALLAALALGLARRRPWPIDVAWQRDAALWFDGQPEVLGHLVLPSEPVVLVPVVVVVVVLCMLGRDRPAALLAATAPLVAVLSTTAVLKPMFRALSAGTLEYPSGHTASLAAVCALLVLLTRPGVARAVSAGVGMVLVVAAGIGMVAAGYHYPFDIVGGCAVGVGVVVIGHVTRRRLAPTPSTG